MNLCFFVPSIPIWRPLSFDGDYDISDQGFVVSHKRATPFPMVPKKDHRGYYRVSVSPVSKKGKSRIHRLVASTFIPNPDQLPEVNHKDGVKTNNRVGNLEWVTHRRNMEHASEIDLLSRGEGKKDAKLNEQKVVEIRGKYATGNYSMREIAKEYGVSMPTIRFIINRWKWRKVL